MPWPIVRIAGSRRVDESKVLKRFCSVACTKRWLSEDRDSCGPVSLGALAQYAREFFVFLLTPAPAVAREYLFFTTSARSSPDPAAVLSLRQIGDYFLLCDDADLPDPQVHPVHCPDLKNPTLDLRLPPRLEPRGCHLASLCFHDCREFEGIGIPWPLTCDRKFKNVHQLPQDPTRGSSAGNSRKHGRRPEFPGAWCCFCSLACLLFWFYHSRSQSRGLPLAVIREYARQRFGLLQLPFPAPDRTLLDTFTLDSALSLTLDEFRSLGDYYEAEDRFYGFYGLIRSPASFDPVLCSELPNRGASLSLMLMQQLKRVIRTGGKSGKPCVVVQQSGIKLGAVLLRERPEVERTQADDPATAFRDLVKDFKSQNHVRFDFSQNDPGLQKSACPTTYRISGVTVKHFTRAPTQQAEQKKQQITDALGGLERLLDKV